MQLQKPGFSSYDRRVLQCHLLPDKLDVHYRLRRAVYERQLVPKFIKMYVNNCVVQLKHSY